MEKKASFKSNTVNQEAVPGMVPNKLYGLGTTGWSGTTASLIALKSWTSLYSLFGFLTGKIGVLQGEL